ncbi:hypothetical protein [Paenibacillus xylanexedens]|uniref:hypothetical protein n=1 Tax=Paenibacillus xylanexedens TaxID=528191 RepID=UPI0011A5E827|nr:hypothetical protein [Paenibacillus xylanexedens]
MVEMSNEEILELAKKWGIDVEENSDKPGFFVSGDTGLTEMSIEELLGIEDEVENSYTIDLTITKALTIPGATIKKVKEQKIGFSQFRFDESNISNYEVA